MRGWRTSVRALLGVVISMAVCGSAMAGDKPDALAILKKHPEFVTLTQYTDMKTGDVNLVATLCRRKDADCEMFVDKGNDLPAMADYVYLFAVYEGKYGQAKGASSAGGKGAAAALLEEAKTKGYGQALLGYYTGKYPCKDSQDAAACVLHKLWGAGAIERRIFRKESDGSYALIFVDEDGSSIWSN